MAIKFFLVPVANLDDAERELNAFLRSHRVLSTERNWVDQGAASYWAVSVDYLESSGPVANSSAARDSIRGKVDYRQVLSPEEFAQFATLRDLRKEIATTEAVPVYTVFTNEQLATMVRQRITTKADVEKIAGVGDARVVKYADRFLSVLNSFNEVTNAPSRPVV